MEHATLNNPGYGTSGDCVSELNLMTLVQVLQKQWFCNKRCLDIGCNAGAVAIAIARMFHTQTVLGIDIDSSLIQHACRCAHALALAYSLLDMLGLAKDGCASARLLPLAASTGRQSNQTR